MTEVESGNLYGWAEIDPQDPVVAGETGTWKITYHAGRYGVDDGGVIKIAWRDVSDWQAPQFSDPQALGLETVMESVEPDACGERELSYWERLIDRDEMAPQPVARAAIRWAWAMTKSLFSRFRACRGVVETGRFARTCPQSGKSKAVNIRSSTRRILSW